MAEHDEQFDRTMPPCPSCDGDGWYLDHADECYENGDCSCSGVQRQCEACAGTGVVNAGI